MIVLNNKYGNGNIQKERKKSREGFIKINK